LGYQTPATVYAGKAKGTFPSILIWPHFCLDDGVRFTPLRGCFKIIKPIFQQYRWFDLIQNVKQIWLPKPHKSRIWRWQGLVLTAYGRKYAKYAFF
jgi:hypothetical protein